MALSQLSFYLAPFSSDYAGACSALFDFNAVVVIHDGHCCTSNYTSFDEPRWFGSRSSIYCSGLREIDAIMGNDGELIRKISQLLDELEVKPDFIALLGSPVPSIIGTDFQGLARELECELKIQAIGLPTAGISYYDRGIDLAMQALIQRFCDGSRPKQNGRINVLGLTPLDFSDNENAGDLLAFLREEGWDAHSLTMGASIEDIRDAARAEVNLAVSRAGLALADRMEKQFDIPYVAATIFGTENQRLSDRLCRTAGKVLDDNVICLNTESANCTDKAGCLLIGDQVIANSIREHLEGTYGLRNITVGSFFGIDPRISRPQDLHIRSEAHLMQIFQSGCYRTVAADPLLWEIPGTDRLYRIDLPHVAVSSRLYWNSCPRFASEEGDELLERLADDF